MGAGRPEKRQGGLYWFPYYIGLMKDPKLVTPRRKFGSVAIVIYLQLLEMIYRDKGYYLEYNDQTRDDVIWAIKSEVLHGKYEPDETTVANVIDSLAACRLFSHDLYEAGFITSRRVQEQFYKSTTERKNLDARWDIWLLSEQEMRDISTRNVLLDKYISEQNNSNFSVEKLPEADGKIPQSRVEESREEKRIFTLTSTLPTAERLEKILGWKLNSGNRSSIYKMIANGVSYDMLIETAKYAVQNAKGDKAAYFMTVLRNRIAKKENSSAIQSESYGTSDGYGHPVADPDPFEQAWLERVRNYKPDKEEADV